MDISAKPQYLAISEHSSVKGTPEAIRDWLTSSWLASPANPSALPESKPEKMTLGTSGLKLLSASASYDPDSHCWRTFEVSLLTSTFSEFSETWPRAGMIVDGKLYRRLKWERRINEIGSGLWRTPASKEPGVSPERLEPIEGGELGGMNRHFDKETGRMAQIGLTQQVKLRQWATPASRDSGSHTITPNYPEGFNKNLCTDVEMNRRMEDKPQGQLNPDWVCWLMGWPIGADGLKPMPDLLWLDWEIDPADMEKPGNIVTPTYSFGQRGGIAQPESNHDTEAGFRKLINEKGIGTGPIPRVATGIKDRVNRLKALGNGQVPQCMATAVNILTGNYFK